ncbi:MAG TPA: VacB/RNase II family 3'-5' exoribonuclease [Kiritimatiellia bacterium]|nr:VacB/RNase II family 3'-5' exoribonuclease [Kiritimatiellia bacterium]HMO97902.1 VacB/RNase II family 3'-5' exoribonuclease [Kiritimatiellia bacterium]HMP95578.1 VacB/RNase II family 3'-5' exoribonuclease [Kiritimatiellia bacterium]
MKNPTAALGKKLLEFLGQADYRPLKDHDLADELGVLFHQRSAFRELLRELSHAGHIRKIKGNRWATARAGETRAHEVIGIISVSPQGHAMVRLRGKSGSAAEVFIPPRGVAGALHGDEVAVEIVDTGKRTREPTEPPTRLRPEGRVVRVIRRGKSILVGLLMKSPAYWYVIPDHPRINQNVRVSGRDAPGGRRPDPGNKVVVRLAESVAGEMLQGEIIEDLGDANAPGVDVLSILREHDIAVDFSVRSEREARQHASAGLAEFDGAGRLDLREECIITIDPADAKDHDDAVSLRPRPEGGWILGVHIADVSHFVTPGSAIDEDARRHGNSVYMVDRFIPMLPPYLTAEVCSLKAGRDRLAYSVFITYNEEADVEAVEMKASLIHPRILLDYESVQELIVRGVATAIPGEYHDVLLAMHDVATRLRKKRMSRGAIDLAMPEVTCRLDDRGRPVSIKRRAAPEAYHLIEEFMLAANVAVAERLHEARTPALYRVHEEPSEEQWEQMAADLQQLGVMEHPTDRHDAQRIGRAYNNQPLGYPVSVAILRNFKRALYQADCAPHFGLAFDHYTHFTSPIRRYSDLVVHRILKGLDAGHGGTYSTAECEEVAEHCSRREREADEAEEESLHIKRIQFYEAQLEKGAIGPWPALITGATARGILVEIVETLQRGFIPIHALPDPTMKIDRSTGYLTGRKGRRIARLGDVVPVSLMRVDRGRRSVELRWEEGSRNVSGEGKSTSRSPRRARRR